MFKGVVLEKVNKLDIPQEHFKGFKVRKKVKNRAGLIDSLNDGYVLARHKKGLEDSKFDQLGNIIKVGTKYEGDVVTDGYNSIELGRGPIRNATRPQKYKKPPKQALIEYVANKDIFDAFECDVSRAVISDGCYESNKHTLIRQLTPDNLSGDFYKHPTVENLEVFDEAIKVVLRKLKMYDQIDQCTVTDLLECCFDGNKKPGYRYEEEFNLYNKSQAVNEAYTLAQKRWDYVSKLKSPRKIKRSKLFPGYYTIGARAKRDHSYDNGELTNSRVVHMPEFHCEMTAAPWCDFITDEIKSKKAGPLYIGNSILDWRRLNRDIRSSQFVIEGDWKRFDSSLYIKMVTMVIAIMRTFYPLNSIYIDNHFISLFDSIAFKDYVLPGGRVVRAFHGLASGVKSTSLINSIANLISLVFCVGPKKSKLFNFIVGGDDFLVSARNSHKKKGNNIDELIKNMEVCSEILGMKFKFLKTKYYESDEIENCPVFYKYSIFKGMPVVPTSSVLERCFMPWNKNYSTKFKYLSFLRDVKPSLGTPLSHLILYYKTLRDLTFLCSGFRLSYREIIKSHQRLSDAMFSRKIYSSSVLQFLTGVDFETKKDVARLIRENNSNVFISNLYDEFLKVHI